MRRLICRRCGSQFEVDRDPWEVVAILLCMAAAVPAALWAESHVETSLAKMAVGGTAIGVAAAASRGLRALLLPGMLCSVCNTASQGDEGSTS